MVEKLSFNRLSDFIKNQPRGSNRDMNWEESIQNFRQEINQDKKFNEEWKEKLKDKMDQFKDSIRVEDIEEVDDNDDKNDDSDIEIDGNTQNIPTVCPLSQKPFEFPVKTKLCSHIFERNAIEDYLNKNGGTRNKIACPVVGCKALFSIKDIKRDVQAEKIMKKRQKLQQNQLSQDEEMLDFTQPDSHTDSENE